MSSPATDRCRVLLRDIAQILPVLENALTPEKVGGRASHAPPSEDQVAAFRAERAEKHLLQANYLPESQVPVDLDVVIALTDVKSSLTTAYGQAIRLAGLPERCRRCNHLRDDHYDGARCGLCSPCPEFAETYRPPSDWRAWDAVLSHAETVASVVEPHLVTALRTAESVLSDSDDVRLLMTPCPWCAGKTAAMPSGSLTLKVHVSNENATHTFVVCHNLECPVPEDDCGSRYRGRPMWLYHELDWLNSRLDHAATSVA